LQIATSINEADTLRLRANKTLHPTAYRLVPRLPAAGELGRCAASAQLGCARNKGEEMRYKLEKLSEKFWMKLAWALPRKLVMWSSIRLIAHATTGKYGSTVVPELSAMDAVKRWDETP
jgi:hypothetical protein